MADEGTATSIFPPPPPFYKHFTPANIERLKELKDANSAKQGIANGGLSFLDLPPELRYLVPPEPPEDGIYRSFGETVDVSPPYPPPNVNTSSNDITRYVTHSQPSRTAK
jgi:mediator of RNA polymerase II transcription subunit 7